MDRLWSPWRMEYIVGPKPDACVFCLTEDTGTDAERLVLYRTQYAFVIMNKYPYNCGHLMVAPLRHEHDYCALTPEECADIFNLSQQCVTVLQKQYAPQGFNLGFNVGAAAGAGVKDHLHYHVVPRWNGDSSFMAVLGEVRTLPQHLDATYAQLKPCFNSSIA